MSDKKARGTVKYCLSLKRREDGAIMAYPPVTSKEEAMDLYHDLDIPMLEEYEVLGISTVIFFPPVPIEK